MVTSGWPPPPNDTLWQWLVSNGLAQDAAIDEIKQQIAELRALLTNPVRGTIHLKVGKDEPVTLAVHPTDTLDATVAWENAENQVVPEVHPTTWSATDAAGAAATLGTITPDPATDDHVTVTGLQLGDFFLVATTQDQNGAAVVAKSTEDISVSDANPTHGVVTVVMGA